MSWSTRGSSHSYVPFSVSMPSFAFGPSHIWFAGNTPHLSPSHPHPGDLSSHFRSQPCSPSLAVYFHWVLHCWCCTVWWLSHSRARTMSSSGLSRSSAACALNTSRGAIHFIVCEEQTLPRAGHSVLPCSFPPLFSYTQHSLWCLGNAQY